MRQINGKSVNVKQYSVGKACSPGIETVFQDHSLGEKQPLWLNVFVGHHLHNTFGFINIAKEKELTLAAAGVFTKKYGCSGVEFDT